MVPKAIEQLVRDRGERFVIAINASSRDHVIVSVGRRDVFEATRRYKLARKDEMWRIEKVENYESGW